MMAPDTFFSDESSYDSDNSDSVGSTVSDDSLVDHPTDSSRSTPGTKADSNVQVPREVVWERKPKLRPDNSRVDVYYYVQGETKRFRSKNEIEEHCRNNNVKYDPQRFDFSGKNKFKGVVGDKIVGSTSNIATCRQE